MWLAWNYGCCFNLVFIFAVAIYKHFKRGVAVVAAYASAATIATSSAIFGALARVYSGVKLVFGYMAPAPIATVTAVTACMLPPNLCLTPYGVYFVHAPKPSCLHELPQHTDMTEILFKADGPHVPCERPTAAMTSWDPLIAGHSYCHLFA